MHSILIRYRVNSKTKCLLCERFPLRSRNRRNWLQRCQKLQSECNTIRRSTSQSKIAPINCQLQKFSCAVARIYICTYVQIHIAVKFEANLVICRTFHTRLQNYTNFGIIDAIITRSDEKLWRYFSIFTKRNIYPKCTN